MIDIEWMKVENNKAHDTFELHLSMKETGKY